MKKKKLEVVDLFAGIKGASYGLEQTGGFKTTHCVEIHPRRQKVIKKNSPKVKILADVKDFCRKNLKKTPDVIWGSFPCQGASAANVNGKGLEDERTGLWSEIKRITNEFQPKYLIAENVPNLRTRGLNRVIYDLWEIGYVGRADIISARAFGAVHPRERLFIIATHADNYRFITETYAKATEDYKREWEDNRRAKRPFMSCSEWSIEPDVGRVVHELPYVLDISTRRRRTDSPAQARVREIIKELDGYRAERIIELGNAVYPKASKWIGEQILKHEGML